MYVDLIWNIAYFNIQKFNGMPRTHQHAGFTIPSTVLPNQHV
jgi:hypothetical protein